MVNAVGRDAISKFETPTAEQLSAARDIVARFAERWDRPAADELRDLMHPDTQNLIPPMSEPADRDGVVEHFRRVLQQLPDLRISVDRWAPTADAVLIEWRARATVAGVPMSWTGVDRFCVRGDKMYEARVYWDTRGLTERMAQVIAQASGSQAQ